MISHANGDPDKWRGEYIRFNGWNTARQRRVQEKEAQHIVRWLVEEKRPRYDILEVGCGDGYVGVRIAELLTERSIHFSYHFTDLLPECVERARFLAQQRSLKPDRVLFSVLDVYHIDESLGSEEVPSVVISTGFASAATYKEAIPVVSQILQKDGFLIVDFVNHLSPFFILIHPVQSLQRFRKYKRHEGKTYHFGILGVRDFFGAHGLCLLKRTVLRLRRSPLLCMFKKTCIMDAGSVQGTQKQ